MKKRPTFEDYKKRSMQDKEFKAEYERLKPEFAFIEQLILARIATNTTQAELAKRLHTKQPAVARFENGGFSKASIETLQDYAAALGYELRINLVPKEYDAKDHKQL